MSKSIALLSQRLDEFYKKWKDLDSADKRKAEINTVIRYMHVISYFAALGRISGNPDLQKFNAVLGDFAAEFKRLYDFDITQTRNADVSPALSKRIYEAQHGGAKLSAAEIEEIRGLKNSYFYAQMGAAFRYGLFMEKIFHKGLTDEERAQIAQSIKSLAGTEYEATVLAHALTDLYKSFHLAEKSSIVTKGDSGLFDDLQLHAFLNQFATEEEMRLASTEVLLDDEQFADLLASLDGSRQDRTVTRAPEKGRFGEAEKAAMNLSLQHHAQKGIKFLGGLEIEGLFKVEPLHAYGIKSSAVTRRNELRSVMVDWNPRVKKLNDTKLAGGKTAYEGTPPKIENMAAVIGEITFPESELGAGGVESLAGTQGLARESAVIEMFVSSGRTDISRENYNRILASVMDLRIQDLREREESLNPAERQELRHLEAYQQNPQNIFGEVVALKKMIASMTRQEALYYDLMFVSKTNSQYNVELDGVYYPGKSELENFRTVFHYLQDESFHAKTYDMIRATEFAIGPEELDTLLEKRNGYLRELRFAANKHGLSFNDPNTQVNLSATYKGKNIFMPQITPGTPPKVEISALGVEYMRMMQEVVAEMAQEQGILRGQTAIETSLDCKKTIRDSVKGFRELDPTLSGFAQHRTEAAKDVTLRWSVIDEAKGISVVEVRLVVQNPHFAYDDAQKSTFRHGGDFASEEILKRLTARFDQFVQAKSEEELAQLAETKIPVMRNGRIEGLAATKVTSEIMRDPLNATANAHQNLRHGVDARALAIPSPDLASDGRDSALSASPVKASRVSTSSLE